MLVVQKKKKEEEERNLFGSLAARSHSQIFVTRERELGRIIRRSCCLGNFSSSSSSFLSRSSECTTCSNQKRVIAWRKYSFERASIALKQRENNNSQFHSFVSSAPFRRRRKSSPRSSCSTDSSSPSRTYFKTPACFALGSVVV